MHSDVRARHAHLRGHDATIDADHLAGHVGRGGRCEVERARRDVLRLTEARYELFLEAWSGADFASRADLASREQQITVANRLYAKNGLRDWTCKG